VHSRIAVSTGDLWNALTNPVMIKKYFLGTLQIETT
jgi:hypothetical protein